VRRALPGRTRGYTLLELLAALTLVGILASLAAPALGGYVHWIRIQRVMNELRSDFFYARMLAARTAHRVEIRFDRPAEQECIDAYNIVLLTEPEREAKRARVNQPGRDLCLRKNGPNPLVFSSRGRPNWNYSFWVRSGAKLDSLTVNQLGRVYRW
jgi:prepilin-type N-terminal cleavage/methylation domain-containing protein